MNHSNELFKDLFCDPANKSFARMYLASLAGETENAEAYHKKTKQISLLYGFFESSTCVDKEYYLQILRDIESILENDRVAGGWNT